MHAQVRRLLKDSEEWDAESWGLPLSSAHMGFAITAFSARLLKHMKRLGATYNDEERESFMAIWRYTGYLMGIPETILFRDEAEALTLFEIGHICEPPPPLDSVVMAHSLINSAPLVLGADDTKARRNLARFVFKVSHGLIGTPLARQLRYPTRSSFGVLLQFQMQQRYQRIKENAIGKFLPERVLPSNYSQFTSLIEASLYDEKGITYGVPDHVYAEESSRW